MAEIDYEKLADSVAERLGSKMAENKELSLSARMGITTGGLFASCAFMFDGLTPNCVKEFNEFRRIGYAVKMSELEAQKNEKQAAQEKQHTQKRMNIAAQL